MGIMSELINQITEVRDEIEIYGVRLTVVSTGTDQRYKGKITSWNRVNPTTLKYRILGSLESLEFLYPALFDPDDTDEHIEQLYNYLEEYEIEKRGLFGTKYEFNKEVMMKMTVPLRTLYSKLSLTVSGLEGIHEDMLKIQSTDYTGFVEGLIASEKDLSPIRRHASALKGRAFDRDLWGNCWNDWEKLNNALYDLGFYEYHNNSEKIMSNLHGRYITSSRINDVDAGLLREFSNYTLHLVEVRTGG